MHFSARAGFRPPASNLFIEQFTLCGDASVRGVRRVGARSTTWNGQDDGAVVAATLVGDQGAADELFHRFQPHLARRMAHWTRDSGRADDLAQEAWLKALRALPRFDQSSPFWPWLRCIADNTARSDLRARLVPSGHERVVCLDRDEYAHRPATGDDEARADDRDLLTFALYAIPARQRRAFMAVAYDGVSMAAAAADFGLTQNAFRQLYHRARHRLRQQLEGALGVAPLSWLHRARFGLRDIFESPGMTLSQVGSAFIGIVAVVVLVPAMENAGRAATITRDDRPVVVEHVKLREEPRTLRVPQRKAQVNTARNEDATAPRHRSRVPAVISAAPVVRSAPAPTRTHMSTTRAEQPEALIQAPSAQVQGTGIRGHQDAPVDPDYDYGVRVDPPVGPRQQVGYQAKDSRLRPVHEVACAAASESDLTYCNS